MNSFVKTCIAQVAVLAALALPAFAGGCERQSEPPVNPQSPAGGAARAAGAQNPPAAPTRSSLKAEDQAARTQG